MRRVINNVVKGKFITKRKEEVNSDIFWIYKWMFTNELGGC